jgi:hypothetical protein
VLAQNSGDFADLVNNQSFTAVRGAPFQAQLLATGPVARFDLPPSWVTTPFPNWLSVSETGILSGTPPAATPIQTISVGLVGPNNQLVETFQLTVLDAASPTIATSVTSLTGFSTTAGAPSNSQSLRVSGTGLQGGITIAAPAGFQVSNNNSLFSESVTLAPTGNAVPETDIYVRIAASAATGSAFGNLSLSSAGATTKTLNLSGSVAVALSRPVTFSVDMTIQIALGRFFPKFDRVEIRGTFNDFAGSELFDADGDGIYSGTLVINGSPGTIQKYKFFVPTNNLSWEAGADRTFALGVGNTAQILEVLYFNNVSTFPPVLLGTLQPSALYVGGVSVSRLHLGEVQVFP